MGKMLKRVPQDFAWPLHVTWQGYYCPLSPQPCYDCLESGHSPAVLALKERWYGNDRPPEWIWCDASHTNRYNAAAWYSTLDQDDIQALLDEDRLWDFTHIPKTEEQMQLVEQRRCEGKTSWLPFSNGTIPTVNEVNEWNRKELGTDSIDTWIIIRARAKKLNLPLYCQICQGEGYLFFSDGQREQYKGWQRTEPPKGDGYQLWEIDAPYSPVFTTLEALSEWCAEHAHTFADHTATAAEWKHMLETDTIHYENGNMIFL